MISLTSKITGTSQVIERLQRITPAIQSKVMAQVQRLTIGLQRSVIQDKLQGQVLNVRTGRLQRSIGQAVTSSNTNITGIVSTNVVYARAHEYGFQGAVNVKAHMRTITQAFGKELKSPVSVSVGAHSMKMNLPEKSFLRSALADMADQARSDIRQAAIEGAKS